MTSISSTATASPRISFRAQVSSALPASSGSSTLSWSIQQRAGPALPVQDTYTTARRPRGMGVALFRAQASGSGGVWSKPSGHLMAGDLLHQIKNPAGPITLLGKNAVGKPQEGAEKMGIVIEEKPSPGGPIGDAQKKGIIIIDSKPSLGGSIGDVQKKMGIIIVGG